MGDTNLFHASDAVMKVMSRYALADGEQAFDWVTGLPVAIRRRAIPALINQISQDAPVTARRLVERIDDRRTRERAAYSVVASWVRRDPDAAVAWIDSEEDATVRDSLYGVAFDRWSLLDRNGALSAVRRLDDSGRDAAIGSMINSALSNPDAEWIDVLLATMESDARRRSAARRIYRRLLRENPKLAERYRELAQS